ncbi:putative uncharacterized transposon-derived protein F54H12.3 [Trichonephila clavipes]|nr:putative uncharacterized transposon-derived protein F54H12.3 [Trichonephila clavipes]
MNQQYQADLVDMQSLSKFNDGYRYLLTCICVLSKYAWAIPLHDKNAKTVVSAFEQIFSERVPLKLQTDAGKEFTNKLFQNYLKKKKIGFFMTSNNTKASIVERFNRTLKTKMWKFFTEKNTKRYIGVVDKLVYSYNNTWHRSIQMTPASVTETNQSQVWENLYGYEQNWTREIFTIHDIIRRNPIVYKLKDLAGEVIRGTFYEQELQKVTHSGYYPIEKILKTREKNGFSKLLGFEPGEIKGKVESSYIADPNASFPLIYVYSDLVEPQIVGDVQAPLLKIVKVEGKDGEVVNAHYTRPHYVPVIRRHFQTVEMVLRLHSGELVPFERGRVIAVLHFRMRQIEVGSKDCFALLLPFLTRGAKSVGKEVLKTGTQIVNDLLEGQNLEDAAKHRTKETGRKLAREAIKKADDMLGQGKKYKRKKRFSKHIIPSKARKAKGRDIFDT